MISYILTVPNLFGVFVALIIWASWRHYFRNILSNMPGIDGFPLLGCLPMITWHPEKAITKWGEYYGDVFYISLGPLRVVVLDSYDAIREAFARRKHEFSGRPRLEQLEKYCEGNGLIFIDYSNKWLEQHLFALTTLREYGMGKLSIETQIKNECDSLCDILNEKATCSEGCDISLDVSNSVSNVISGLVFGQMQPAGEKSVQQSMEYLSKGEKRKRNELRFVLSLFFPFLIKFRDKKLSDVGVRRRNMYKRLIREHRDSLDVNNPRDFMDSFLIKMSKVEQDGKTSFTEDQLVFLLQDFFFAGTDTTSTTLMWTILFLSINQEIQEKLFQEIKSVNNEPGNVSWKTLTQYPYTRAVMHEIFRVRPIIPLGVVRTTTEDVTFRGHRMPKGTPVIPNIWGVHHHPKYWAPDPDSFRPERHLDENGKFQISERVIPFSTGPRSCLGAQLAKMEYFIFLVGLVERFVFSLPKDIPTPRLDGHTRMTLTPVHFKVVAEPRRVLI